MVELNAACANKARPGGPAGRVEDVANAVDKLDLRPRAGFYVPEEIEDAHGMNCALVAFLARRPMGAAACDLEATAR